MPAGRRASSVHVTKREADVLNLLSQGLGNAEIGLTLGVETSTVKHHLNSAQAKLLPANSDKINSRVLLARWGNYPLFRIGAGRG